MIPAILKGKLSQDQVNMEDLLVSTVFGLLQYVPPQLGLLKLLAEAESSPGAFPLPQSARDNPIYDFWRGLQEKECQSCEPDLLITMADNTDRTHLILIEAKYWSPKSSYADESSAVPTDQLAKEWDNLIHLCVSANAIPHLIYITQGYEIPQKDISEAADEFQRKRPEFAQRYPFRCWWLSWRHMTNAFRASTSPILKDLVELSNKYGFRFYAGITPISPTIDIQWRFESNRAYSFWPSSVTFPSWSFTR